MVSSVPNFPCAKVVFIPQSEIFLMVLVHTFLLFIALRCSFFFSQSLYLYYPRAFSYFPGFPHDGMKSTLYTNVIVKSQESPYFSLGCVCVCVGGLASKLQLCASVTRDLIKWGSLPPNTRWIFLLVSQVDVLSQVQKMIYAYAVNIKI